MVSFRPKPGGIEAIIKMGGMSSLKSKSIAFDYLALGIGQINRHERVRCPALLRSALKQDVEAG